MTQAKKEEQRQARELRKQGWTITKIAVHLSVSKSSVSVWCRDIELTAGQKDVIAENQKQYGSDNKGAATNRRRALRKRRQYQQAGHEAARSGRPLHEMGCMLYWAEGYKHRNYLHFANSDDHMLRLFMRFLREELNVTDADIKLQIVCHVTDEDDIALIERHWLDMFGLDADALRATQSKVSTGKTRNRLDYGVCAIIVQSTELVQHIYGAIQEYGGFEDESWLV